MPDKESPTSDNKTVSDFENASEEKQSSLFSEFMGFMKETRKFWLLPLILIMLALGALLVMTNSALAPFIYTLF